MLNPSFAFNRMVFYVLETVVTKYINNAVSLNQKRRILKLQLLDA